MASAAPNAGTAATAFKDNSFMNPASADFALRRDSRIVEYQSPIPEEDESVGTASEPAEPVTPTSDTTPFTNPFHDHDNMHGVSVPSKFEMQDPDLLTPLASAPASAPASVPAPAPAPAPVQSAPSNPASVTTTEQTSRPAVFRTRSNVKLGSSPPDQPSSQEKPGLGKRVGSFMRNRLHRAPSNKGAVHANVATTAPVISTERTIVPKEKASAEKPLSPVKNEMLSVKTGIDGPAEVSAPTLSIPVYRRLSSFSLSARNSPKSSYGNSPPSPGSPSSTISDETQGADRKTTEKKPRLSQKHSSSSTAISSMNQQRSGPGITWAGGSKDVKKSRFSRRRSASTELVPKLNHDDNTVGLIDTFSKRAEEGVGMKARRLSVSLPDEFVVDSCDLDKEFKSSSLMPGKRGKCLGRGATAEVRIMTRREGRGSRDQEDLVAVKEFRGREKDEDEDEYQMKIKSEYSIAKSLHHPNIVETVRLCTNRGRWNHVMEFCAHGELFTLVERKLFSAGAEGYYSVDDRLCFFKQLLRGVEYLHAHGIAHRDIKLENLLLDREGHLKISDFGVAEVFSGEHPGLRAAAGECGKNMGEIRLSTPGICGSMPYIAPEVLAKTGTYDPRPLDVWSCAIVFLTMTFGGSPWQAAKPEYEYYARFKKGWDEWLPSHADGLITEGADGHPKCGKLFSLIQPPPIKRLLLKMLHPMPDKRISIQDIMKTNCVKSIDCCCPESYEESTCGIDASKFTSKQTSKLTHTKRHLHHHIPPQPEKKIAKVLQHRFDMGDGW